LVGLFFYGFFFGVDEPAPFWDLNGELEELKIVVLCYVGRSGQGEVYQFMMVQKDGCYPSYMCMHFLGLLL